MTDLPPDPLANGIADFGAQLRAGKVTSENVTADYLRRIECLEPRLESFEQVDGDGALATARALDALLVAGTDLGPLMGVPVALKDIIAADGMPVTAGSNLDVSDLIGPEGRFVKELRRAGCVILGKTKTVEFAMGGAGTNYRRGTPWNPWDAEVPRAPGGSSSGSAVAMAAGLCGFSIGSDTGGSVRGPAGFCGVLGIRPTSGTWPLTVCSPCPRPLTLSAPLPVPLTTWRSCSRPSPPAEAAAGAAQGRPARQAVAQLLRGHGPGRHPLRRSGAGRPRKGGGGNRARGLAGHGGDLAPLHHHHPGRIPGHHGARTLPGGPRGHESGRGGAGRRRPFHHGRRLHPRLWRREELCRRAAHRLEGLDALLAPAKSRVAAIVPPGEDASTTSKLAEDHRRPHPAALHLRLVRSFGAGT